VAMPARSPTFLTTPCHGHDHGLSPHPHPRPRPGPAAGGGGARARVARLCPFLGFLIKMNNFQPYKLSQHSVKTPYGIKPIQRLMLRAIEFYLIH